MVLLLAYLCFFVKEYALLKSTSTDALTPEALFCKRSPLSKFKVLLIPADTVQVPQNCASVLFTTALDHAETNCALRWNVGHDQKLNNKHYIRLLFCKEKKSFHVLPAPCHVTSPSPRYEKASLHGRYGERDRPVELKDTSVHFPM